MNLEEIKKDVYFLTNTSSATYADDDLVRNINRHYDNVVTLLWHNAEDWSFDDSQSTTLPFAYANLISGQGEYSLPTNARRIRRVEVQKKDGDWVLLKPISEEEIHVSLDEYMSTPGIPVKYTLIANSLFLFPPPDSEQVTTASGLKVFMDRSVTPLSASGDEPGFPSEFHRILSLGAAQDYCIAYEMNTKEADLRREKLELEAKLIEYISKRWQDRRPRIFPRKEFYL